MIANNPSMTTANSSLEWPIWFIAIVRPNIVSTRAAGKICVKTGDLVNPLWFISILFIYVFSGDYCGPLELVLFYISNIKIRKRPKLNHISHNGSYWRKVIKFLSFFSIVNKKRIFCCDF
jgi:hypothetical protein